MSFIYHHVPTNQEGSILYPLNQLKNKYPHLYADQIAKYRGREFVMSQTVPILNCLWNDVLHFTTVHPLKIKQALQEFGYPFSGKYYQINSDLLPVTKTVIYLYQQKIKDDKYQEGNFIPYNSESLDQYDQVTPRTKKYYQEMISNGKNPLLYVYTPHILYRGELDTQDLPVIEV